MRSRVVQEHRAVSLEPAATLSAIVAALAVVASAGGLFLRGLYRDNTFVTAAWRGSDVVTLIVAVPLLAGAARLAIDGSRRALLVWLGMLDYMLYAYAYYVFGAAFNRFFLIYVAIFALSTQALIFALAGTDAGALSAAFGPRTPVRAIAAYMLIVAAGLSAVYVAQSIGFIVTGELPAIVVATGHSTSIVFAIDLSLLVPGLVLGGFWLWQRRPWGYLLAGILNIKGAVYTLGLAVGSWQAAKAGIPGAAAQLPFWGLLSLCGTIASVALLRRLGTGHDRRTSQSPRRDTHSR